MQWVGGRVGGRDDFAACSRMHQATQAVGEESPPETGDLPCAGSLIFCSGHSEMSSHLSLQEEHMLTRLDEALVGGTGVTSCSAGRFFLLLGALGFSTKPVEPEGSPGPHADPPTTEPPGGCGIIPMSPPEGGAIPSASGRKALNSSSSSGASLNSICTWA